MWLCKSQNIFCMLECKLEDMIVTAWLLYWWSIDHLVEIFPLFDQTWLQLGVVMTLAAASQDLVVYQTEVRSVGCPGSWSDKVRCFELTDAQFSQTLWAGALSCQQTLLPDQWLHQLTWQQLKHFVVDIWKLITSLLMNIFQWNFKVLQRYIQNVEYVILLGCIEIWHFYPILSVVYFFPDSVDTNN